MLESMTVFETRLQAVAVYCGSAHGNNPDFTEAARTLGAELAARGLTLVYGGGNVGLMGEVADATLAAGGRVTGVIPRQLVDREMAHPGLTTLEVVDNMAQRKARMEELADAFICLPGGIGTLEEIVEVLCLQQLGLLDAPVGLVDTNSFWQPFTAMLSSFAQSEFIQQRYVDAIVMDPSPAAVLDNFAGWSPLGAKWDANNP